MSFFFFNDETARRLLAERLSQEVPRGVIDSGCTVAIQGPRFIYQPDAIKDFFFRHFQPYDEYGVFWIWGRSFVKGARNRLEGRFLAVRDGL